jgi:hypothetical protein
VVAPLGKTEPVSAPKVDPSRVDRGDGRDPSGRFTGKGGYGKDGETKGLDQYESDRKRPVVRDKVRATSPDGSIRYYDGLSKKRDGTYEGVEIKSNSASPTASQRKFDASVSAKTPATGMLHGKQITITSVALIEVEE